MENKITHISNSIPNTKITCNEKNEYLENSKEPCENGKLEILNVQEYKYFFALLNKTDDQTKAFHSNLSLPIGMDNSQLINRPLGKDNDKNYELGISQDGNDGTDSGVEVIQTLSSNGSNSGRFTPIQSCGSSLLSYFSEPEIDRGSECGSESSEKNRIRKRCDCNTKCLNNCWKFKKPYVNADRSRINSRKANNFEGDGTSESCSETSSTHETLTSDQVSRFIDFKRSPSNRLHEAKKYENGRLIAIRKSDSCSRSNSFDKNPAKSNCSMKSLGTANRISLGAKSLSICQNIKSGVSSKSDFKASKAKIKESNGTALKNETQDARIMESIEADLAQRSSLSSMSSSLISSSNGRKVKICKTKSSALEKYGTLPRRQKKNIPESLAVPFDMNTSLSRSNSVTREPCLNRAATLRRQQSKEKENSLSGKTLPPYPKFKKSNGKTVIYHEVSIQTVITNKDFTNSCSCIFKNNKGTDRVVKESKGIQTEGKEKHKKIEENYIKHCQELDKAKKEVEKLKSEKLNMVLRICKLLGYPESKLEELNENGLDELEQHFQAIGLTVLKQQEELSTLRKYKLIAHRDLEKSIAAQKNLLQQQQEIEEEYSELQEFLQAEKTALSESLLDTEEELTKLRNQFAKKEQLLDQQQEECKHLVRICEQRRQENLSLEAKLAGLDQRSRDVLVQQGAAVSAAAVALGGLGARLDTLVDQLCVTCNISEKDLEEIIYHKEAYHFSEDNFLDELSTQRTQLSDFSQRQKSVTQIILEAIKNASHSYFVFPKKDATIKTNLEHNSLEVFFNTKADPCVNFEVLLENNSSFSNSIDSGNSSFHIDVKKEKISDVGVSLEYENKLNHSSSLQNLSDAILNRQMVEKNEKYVSLDEIIPVEVNSLVDQIIDIDKLVTKLLKIIKIIQGENGGWVEAFEEERVNLTKQLCQEKLNCQSLEKSFQRLQQELAEARSQLNSRIAQLEEVKALCGSSQKLAVAEIQKRFNIIDTALGILSSIQDVVNECPPLAKLRKDLEDCNFQRSLDSDVNANSAACESGILQDAKRNGTVLATAI